MIFGRKSRALLRMCQLKMQIIYLVRAGVICLMVRCDGLKCRSKAMLRYLHVWVLLKKEGK